MVVKELEPDMPATEIDSRSLIMIVDLDLVRFAPECEDSVPPI